MSRAINYFSIFNNIIINRICYRYLMFVIANKLLIKYTILAQVYTPMVFGARIWYNYMVFKRLLEGLP